MEAQPQTIAPGERQRLLSRCTDFELRLDEDVAERIVTRNGVTALMCPSTPRVWDSNYLRVDAPGLDIATITTAGDATLGAAGMKHRNVTAVDPAEAERLAAELAPLGWEVERDVVMVLRRDPDRPAGASVEEVSESAIEEVRRVFMRVDLENRHPEQLDEDLIEQLVVHDRRLGGVAGDRWFAARHRGQTVSACCLYARDGVGQVESVNTLPGARNRGLARATVLAAAAASLADCNELTFIVADADDWPRQLYARLGFEPVGEQVAARLKPPAG